MEKKNFKAIVLNDVGEFLASRKEFNRTTFGLAVCKDSNLMKNLEDWKITGKTINKVYDFMADYKPPMNDGKPHDRRD